MREKGFTYYENKAIGKQISNKNEMKSIHSYS